MKQTCVSRRRSRNPGTRVVGELNVVVELKRRKFDLVHKHVETRRKKKEEKKLDIAV